MQSPRQQRTHASLTEISPMMWYKRRNHVLVSERLDIFDAEKNLFSSTATGHCDSYQCVCTICVSNSSRRNSKRVRVLSKKERKRKSSNRILRLACTTINYAKSRRAAVPVFTTDPTNAVTTDGNVVAAANMTSFVPVVGEESSSLSLLLEKGQQTAGEVATTIRKRRFYVDFARTWRRSAMPELIELGEQTIEEIMY